MAWAVVMMRLEAAWRNTSVSRATGTAPLPITSESTWLADAGLSTAKIRNHRYNLDFFLNHFLLYGDTFRAPDGVGYVGELLSDWFIRKTALTSKASVNANAVSLKKIYSFMSEKGDGQARGAYRHKAADQGRAAGLAGHSR